MFWIYLQLVICAIWFAFRFAFIVVKTIRTWKFWFVGVMTSPIAFWSIGWLFGVWSQ